MNLNPKIRNVIITLILAVGAACLAAWNGESTWHIAVGSIGAAVVTAAVGYFTSQGDWKPTPPTS